MKSDEQDDILIVEDSPTQAEELKYILEKENFHVSVASSGKEAIDMLRNKPHPAVVISDIVMPGMDGYELCRRIKKDADLKDIPVILLTSLSDPGDILKGLDCGAENFLTKPYNEKYLIARIQHVLANRALSDCNDAEIGLQIYCAGQKYYINAERRQILSLLLSTYDLAVQKNLELKKAAEALQHSEDWYRTIFENTGTATMIIDEDTTVSLVNTRFEKFSGYPKQEVEGKKSWKEFVTEDDVKRLEEYHRIRRINSEAVPGNYEARVVDSGGSIKNILISAAMIPGTKKSVISFLDITEQKRFEHKLKESENRYRRLVEYSPYSIMVHREGKFEFLNPAGIELFGAKIMEELVGKPILQFVHPDFLEIVKERLKQLQQGVEVAPLIEEKFLRLDGTAVDVEVKAIPFIYEGKQATLVVAADITKRKSSEEKLSLLLEELKRSNAELEQFAYVASHDLQEPLRMVASYVQLLERRYKGKLDPDADDFIGFAVDGAKRMQNMITDLLQYSRITTRGKPFEPTDCKAVLDSSLANLKAAIDESNAVVTCDPMPDIIADASQIDRVFQNLIGNAIKFRSDAKPCIHIGVEKKKHEWVFSVKDNGIGFDIKQADRLFKMFQRLQSGDKYPGTGMGLVICKKIVERHGGRIWAESIQGAGSTFHFTIPVRGNVHETI